MLDDIPPLQTGDPEWPDGWGIYRHQCIEDDCTTTVQFDDEPWCFTHSPDEGSSLAGYSAKAEAARIAQLIEDDPKHV